MGLDDSHRLDDLKAGKPYQLTEQQAQRLTDYGLGRSAITPSSYVKPGPIEHNGWRHDWVAVTVAPWTHLDKEMPAWQVKFPDQVVFEHSNLDVCLAWGKLEGLF